MLQGTQDVRSSSLAAKVMLPHGSGRAGRATGRIIALSVLALLCACAQKQTAQVDPYAVNYNRPSSYSPPGPPEDPWGPYIRQAARRFDVPERWIREVMRQESGGRMMATSPVGAMGLMQVMPGTYRELRRRYGLGDDPYHPYDSIMAGTAYVREMYDLYGSPAFLAAYNAGPRRLEDYLWGSRGLPNETRNYVAKIGPRIAHHHPVRRVAPEIAAAGEMPVYVPPGPRRMDGETMMALREQRRNSREPDVQVAQLPPGTVVRMEPIPDGSTYAGPPPAAPPVQIASLSAAPMPAPAPVAVNVPPPGSVIRMEPIPDGSTGRSERRGRAGQADASLADAPAAETAALVAAAEAASAAPLPAPQPAFAAPEPEAAPGPVSRLAPPVPRGSAERLPPARERALPEPRATALASLPLPPSAPAAPQPERRAEPPLTVAALLAPPARAAAPQPAPAPATRGLGLVGTAQAATLRLPVPPPAPTRADRAVQVGAFADKAAAERAAREAQSAAGGGAVSVTTVQQGRATLYRARVVGLTETSARQACDRMKRHGACETVQH